LLEEIPGAKCHLEVFGPAGFLQQRYGPRSNFQETLKRCLALEPPLIPKTFDELCDAAWFRGGSVRQPSFARRAEENARTEAKTGRVESEREAGQKDHLIIQAALCEGLGFRPGPEI